MSERDQINADNRFTVEQRKVLEAIFLHPLTVDLFERFSFSYYSELADYRLKIQNKSINWSYYKAKVSGDFDEGVDSEMM